MDKKIEKNWQTIPAFLSCAGNNLNILEEEVDLSLQKEYFEIIRELSSKPQKYKQLCSQYLEEINNLFDESIDNEVKKRMLVVLARIDDISVYRAIESLSKTDSPLKMAGHCTPSIPHANTINLNGYSGHLHFNRTRRTKRHVKIFLCLSLPQPGNSAGISAPNHL